MTGSLTKEAASTLPVAGATVAVKVTVPGKAPVQVGHGQDRRERVVLASRSRSRCPATLSVVYTGSAGLPAASADVDTVTRGKLGRRDRDTDREPGVGRAREAGHDHRQRDPDLRRGDRAGEVAGRSW